MGIKRNTVPETTDMNNQEMNNTLLIILMDIHLFPGKGKLIKKFIPMARIYQIPFISIIV